MGHPLLDTVHNKISRSDFCACHGINPQSKLIGNSAGSRSKEVKNLLPVFLEAGGRLTKTSPSDTVFSHSKAPTISNEELDSAIHAYSERLNLKIISKDRYDLMAACDVVVAASGTVTLELLLLDTPMVVAYKLSPLTYRLGKDSRQYQVFFLW